MSTRSSRIAPVLLALIALLCLGLLPQSVAPVFAADPGDGLAAEGGGPALESTINGIQIGFAQEYGKTTIWMRACADSPGFQMRSENVGQWTTEVFYRTQAAGGCSPSPTSWWRMVYNADPNTGEVFRIYAYASATALSDAEFMARAARADCRVTGYGTGYCTPGNPVPSWPNSRGTIDQPVEGQSVAGTVSVAGWAIDAGSFSGAGITDVRVYVNGTLIGAASYGGARPDVAAAFSDSRFTNSGFGISFNAASFSPGPATIQVGYRRARDGAWVTMERHVTIAQTIGSLSGQVTSGGKPVAGAIVSLGRQVTRAGADGRYGFSGVQPGSYSLAVTANGYLPATATVTIAAGANTRDVQLAAQAATGFRIPTSPIPSYWHQDGIVNSVNAYFDLNSSNGRIHDAAHPVGSVVPINGRSYTAPWPASIWRLGLAYNGHVGTDYRGTLNQTDVVAAAPGYVLRWRDGSPNNDRSKPGNTVWMRHPNVKGRDLCVLYHHLSPGTISAKVRSVAGRNILIPAGEVLAKVGNSGNSTGAHLHFEVYDCNTRAKIDPYSSGLMDGWAAPALAADPPAPLAVSASASESVVLPGQSITLQAQAPTAVSQYRWTLDTGAELAGQQVRVSFTDAGTHTIWLSAVGADGALGLAEPITISVTPQAGQAGIDTTAPSGAMSAPLATAAPTATLHLSLTASEPVDSAKMRFSTDGVSYTPWEQFAPTRTWNLPDQDGDVTVFAQFADAAGNSSAPSLAVIQVDRTAPAIIASGPLSDPAQPWQVSFIWGVDDLGVEAHGLMANEYMLVGVDSSWRSAGTEQQATYTSVPPGSYTLRVRVTDLAGNAATAERQVVVAEQVGAVYLPLVRR